MKQSPAIRPCAVCGMFYPSDSATIKEAVAELLERVERVQALGTVRGMISPHAGYVYSGYTAAHGFACLQGAHYTTVVIVSPSHREYFDGISISAAEGYATPLGVVMINKELREKLVRQDSRIAISELGHGDEHAIEVQLPFLQLVLPEFTFLPVVLGDQKREYCLELGAALASVLQGEDYLLIASTDLSHYHSSERANKLDSVFIESVKTFDCERLMSDLETGKTEACGGGPTVSVMFALRRLGVKSMNVLHHCNSGDVSGENTRVVGYLSAIGHA